jgi:hypothetical protein
MIPPAEPRTVKHASTFSKRSGICVRRRGGRLTDRTGGSYALRRARLGDRRNDLGAPRPDEISKRAGLDPLHEPSAAEALNY